jgi:D-glycero-D-manno-heptose 1,7-bisphosphate phosphatase
MTLKTIFLDRDGVINKDKHYLYKIEDFEFIEGIFESCRHFQSLNFQIIIISNQSGIDRGYYSENDFLRLNHWMINQFKIKGIQILNTFYCPHLPDANCSCRKPMPGMFNKADKIHGIDFLNSWMIGDKETDIEAAIAAGINKTILIKTDPMIDKYNSKASYIINSIEDSIKLVNT